MDRNQAFTELSRMSKEMLIQVYLRGIKQSTGSVIANAGPASTLRKWSKQDLINSLIDINWPGYK